jgi:hypothetical protein
MERNENHRMSRAVRRWAAAGVIAALLLAVGWFYALPAYQGIMQNVADDWCERQDSGEPVRTDPDCHSNWGVNHVEAWDREYPAP